MTYRKSLHRAAIILLSGTALAATAAPAYASIGQDIKLGVQKSDRAPLDAGQRVETTGAATPIMLNNGTILSFCAAESYTVDTDGRLREHNGHATKHAAGDAVRVHLSGAAAPRGGEGGPGGKKWGRYRRG